MACSPKAMPWATDATADENQLTKVHAKNAHHIKVIVAAANLLCQHVSLKS